MLVYKLTVTDSSNLFISPYSLRIALLAAAAGAKNETEKKYGELIGNYNDAKTLLQEISGETTGGFFFTKPNKLEVANSV